MESIFNFSKRLLLTALVVMMGGAYALAQCPGGWTSQTFNFTGGPQTFTVPAGVTQVYIEAYGAQGQNAAIGGTGGLGAMASGYLTVTPGQVLEVNVGGQNGFNGGGTGGLNGNDENGGPYGTRGGSGGGASDVRAGGVALVDRVIVGGGGGGGGHNGVWNNCQVAGPGGNGGGGGFTNGLVGTVGVGTPCNCGGGGGGTGGGATQVAGGSPGSYAGSFNCLRNTWGPGFPGSFGVGGNGSNQFHNGTGGGGGGGGGYYGGGAGGNGSDTTPGGGGGGGSSYIGGVTSGAGADAVQSGDGLVTICFNAGGGCIISASITQTPANPVCGGTAILTAESPACTGGVGNYTVSPIAFAPIGGVGTTVTLGDDQVSGALPVGFTFNFYGNNYTDFYLSSNGFITFSPGQSSGCCSGHFLPTPFDNPANLIAAAWDDLYPPGAGSVNYFTTGTAPNRILVVNWTSVPYCCNNTPAVSTQILLYESTNIIEVHNTSINNISPGTQGIENIDGSMATVVAGRNSSNWSANGDAFRFSPPVSCTYAWSTGETTQSIVAATSGTYSVTITEPGGCVGVASQVVDVFPAASAVTITQNPPTPICDGSPVTLTVTSPDCGGGCSYLWSTGEVTDNILVGVGGDYDVTVTNANGCTASGTFGALVGTPPTVTIDQDPGNPVCGGPVELTAIGVGGGGGGGPVNKAFVVSQVEPQGWGQPSCANALNSVYGFGGWSDFRVETVNPNTLFDINNFGIIHLEGSNSATNELIAFLSANQSLVENWVAQGGVLFLNYATNENNLDNLGFGGVQSQRDPRSGGSVVAVGHPIFNGPLTPATGNFVGSSLTHNYIINGGTTLMQDDGGRPTLTELSWGSGTVLFGGFTLPFFENGSWGPQPDVYNMYRNIYSYMETAGGPAFDYAWSTGETTGTITVATSGNYCVTVTDENGCTNSACLNLTVNPVPVVTITSNPAGPLCGVANATLTANGPCGGGCTYQWSTGEATQDIVVATDGTYAVTFTDANGCTASAEQLVEFATPTLTISQDPVGVACGVQPVLTALVNGAGAAQTFTASFTQNLDGQAFCSDWQTFLASLTGTYSQLRIFSDLNPGITLNDVTTVNNIANALLNGLNTQFTFGPDTYYIGGCGGGTELAVNQSICNCLNGISVRPCIGAGNSNWGGVFTNTCGGPTQTITVEFGGGGNFTYLWSDGSTTAVTTATAPGVYSVTITTPSGCTVSASQTVNMFPVATATIIPGPNYCAQSDLVAVGGGQAPFTYLWSSGEMTDAITPGTPGTYSVTITDANGCTASADYEAQAPTTATIEVDPVGPACGVNPVLTAVSPNCGNNGNQVFYIRGVNNPWGQTVNQTAMDVVFGAGNWIETDFNFAIGLGPAIFNPGTRFVFMDGSDGSAIEMENFVNANIGLMEAWVSSGGRLFMNSAPNQDNGMSWGFGGVTLNYPSFSSFVSTTLPGHPIFNGPVTPVSTSYTGSSYGHATIGGPSGISLLDGDAPGVVLSELNWGSGLVMFGGMTTTNFHSPNPQGHNIRQNMIDYLNNFGGGGGCTYAWSNGATDMTITANASGTYDVTITTAAGCTASATTTVTIYPAATATIVGGPTYCTQADIMAVAGGTAPFNYLWNTGEVTETITPNIAGTYTVTITDANGCTASSTFDAALPPTLTIDVNPVGPACGISPVLTAVASGAAVTFTETFFQGQGPSGAVCNNWNTFISQLSGTYSQMRMYSDLDPVGYTLTDPATVNAIASTLFNNGSGTFFFGPDFFNVGNCGGMELSINQGFCSCGNAYAIRPCIGADVWGGVNTATCGGPTQTITVQFGAGNYTFLWNTGETTESITPLVSGTYSVTLTNNGGCQVVATQVVDIFPAVTATINGGNDVCALDPMTAVAGGGTAPFSYVWNTGETTETITPGATGTYSVTITDVNGCSASAEYDETAAPVVNITADPANGPYCGVSPELTANVIGGGAASLQEVLDAINNNAGMLIGLVPSPSGFDMDAGVNGNSIGDGCSDMYDGGNVINTNFANAIQYSDNLVVPSGAFGAGGQYFTRYLGPGGCQSGPATMWFLAADLDGVTNLFTTGNNGADGGGNTDGTTFTVANGVTYNCFVKRVFNAGDPSINQLFIIPNGGGASHSFAGNTNDGFHEVTGIGANTRAYMLLYASAFGGYIDDVQTQNIAQNFVNLLGAGVTYAWSDGSTTASITPGASGTYTVTVTDQNGCTGTAAYNVVINPAVTATINGGIDVCALDPMTAVAGGGIAPFTYLWNTGETTDVITPGAGGTYSVTITDAAGCTATTEYNEAAPTTVTIISDPVGPACGVLPVLTAVSNNCGNNGNQVYYIRGVGNPWGQTVNQTAMDVVFGAGNWIETDFNSAIGLGAALFNPGTRFVFMDGSDGSASEMENFVNTNIALMEAWVAAGGRLFMNAAPNQDDGMNWGFGGVTLNYGGPTFSGFVSTALPGHPIFNGPITPVSTSYTGNSYGHATIGGPSGVSLLDGDAPGVVLSELAWGSGLVMFGGMTTTNFHSPNPQGHNVRQNMIDYLNSFGGGGGCTFVWSTGETDMSITGTVSGTYDVTVTTSVGCTASASINVIVSPAVTATINGGVDACALDPMTAVAGGGVAPFSYLWSTGETTDVITPNATGTYSVTITDASGCTATAEYDETAAPVVTISPDPVGPYCGVAPVLNADVIGGMIELTYSEQFLAGQAPPQANCTNWDAFRAQLSGAYTQMRMYSDLDPIGYTLNDPATATGIANTLFNGGNNTFFFGPDFFNVGSCGGMELSINQGFCSCGNAYAIRPCIGADVWGGVNTATCGGPTQTITLSFIANNNTYLWSDGSTTSSITPVASGNYCVTVTDGNGCTGTACYNLVVNPAVTAAITGGPAYCESGAITVEASGGTAPFTYMWNNGDTNATITVSASGTYTATVTDGAGCTATASVAITIYPNPTVTVTQDLPNPLCGANTVVLTATGAGAMGVAGNKALIVSDVEPLGWGQPSIYNAMNNVYGNGGWTEFRFESANAAAVFNIGNFGIIHMDGSDGATTELLAFLSTNQSLIENWVSQGGVLFLNYATNETSNDNLGFGGVSSVRDPRGGGSAALPGHPIFNGPLMPTAGPYSGGSLSHNFIQNGGVTLLVDDVNQPTLTELTWGNGRVLFGGLTLPFFEQGGFGWQPQPNIMNMYQNIYSYMETMGNQPASYTYVWSTGSTDPTTTVNTGGTYTVTVTDNHGCTGSATYDIQISNIAVSGVGVNTTCNAANGSIDLTTTGAIGPVTYMWDNGAMTEDLANIMAGTYVVTATDVNGCTATTEVTIGNDADVTPPSISCPANTSITAGGAVTLADYTGAAIANDNCPGVTVTQSPAIGTVYNTNQTVTVTLTATDASGNTNSCAFEIVITITGGCACPFVPNVVYVDDSATGANTGLNWCDAFTDLQSALAAVGVGGEIWVKEGTYKPSPGASRTATFNLKPNMSMYGGFPDNMPCPGLVDRNADVYVTNLSGDVGVAGVNTDNSYRVVRATNVGANVLVDGVVIRDGYADGVGNINGAGLGVTANGTVSSPAFINCDFVSNYADTRGGGAFVYSLNAGGVCNVSFTDCNFMNNSCQQDGGGVSTMSQNGATFSGNFDNCTFSNNNGGQKGGAAGSWANPGGASSLNFSDCTFTGNTAQVNGGGIWNYSRTGASLSYNIDGCTFTGNSSSNGAAMYHTTLTASMTGFVTGCTFTNNASGNYGTITTYSEKSSTQNNIVVDGCTFMNNTSSKGGAFAQVALTASASTATITQSSFRGNTGSGAGSYHYGSGVNTSLSATMENCEYYGNTSSGSGGAIATNLIGTSSSNITVGFCSFNGNVAATNGGAIQNFTNNSTSVINASNSIFWGNTVTAVNGRTFGTSGPGATTNVSNSIVDNATCAANHFGTGTFTCAGIIAADPMFVGGGDLHLMAGSPAIDAANAGPSEDLDGNSRPFGNGWDWGAYEYGAVLPRIAASEPAAASEQLGMTLFPNPTTGAFTVQFTRSLSGTVEVMDLQGRVLHSELVNEANQLRLNASGYAAGTYYVRLISAEDILVRKVVLKQP